MSGRRYDEVERQPVVIGDRVFIGANAIVNMGVTIGDEAWSAPARSSPATCRPTPSSPASRPAPVARVEIADDGTAFVTCRLDLSRRIDAERAWLPRRVRRQDRGPLGLGVHLPRTRSTKWLSWVASGSAPMISGTSISVS